MEGAQATQDLTQQMALLLTQMQQIATQNQELLNTNTVLEARVAAQEASAQQQQQHVQQQLQAAADQVAQVRATATGSRDDDGGAAIRVSKWAPDQFPGTQEAWPTFKVKYQGYTGTLLKGMVGDWMDHVDMNRTDSAKVAVLGAGAKQSATLMYHALIAVCEGKALVLVEKAGRGEGLEAWRCLLNRYEPRTRQSRVLKHIGLLNWNFSHGEFIDNLERFDKAVAAYEQESGKTMDEEEKIGLIIRGMPQGSLQEHLLLYSERCSSYADFRSEIDTIAKAQAAQLWTTQPMDVSAFGRGGGKKGDKGGGRGGGGGGKASRFEGECRNCGKKGHKAAECWAAKPKPPGGPGGKKGDKGGGRGGGRGTEAAAKCYECGMTNHKAKDCKSSPEKRKAWKKKNGGRVHELDDKEENLEELGGLGSFVICEFKANALLRRREKELEAVRADESNRKIRFGVDTAACVTVTPIDHPAVRGYKCWKDGAFGRAYSCANDAKVYDEGLRVLSIRSGQNAGPLLMRSRSAKVKRPLMCVADLVDANKTVVFDSEGSFSVDKSTGQRLQFERRGKGWDVEFELECPTEANNTVSELVRQQKGEQASSGKSCGGVIPFDRQGQHP